jgi:hypothetical protein
VSASNRSQAQHLPHLLFECTFEINVSHLIGQCVPKRHQQLSKTSQVRLGARRPLVAGILHHTL